MGWEDRERGSQYYYRKRREGRRVVSEYVGVGLVAQLAAEMDRTERVHKAAERAQWQREMAAHDAVDKRIDEVCAQVHTLTQAALVAAGFHQHKGQWRRKRNEQSSDKE